MAAPGGNWQQQLAQEIGVPLSPGVGQFFDMWTRAEGGGATNNPFNTTQPGFNAQGNYNSVGVKNYADPTSGIRATAATLKNGRYGNILAAMRTGDPHAMAQALANSPWGTGALVLKMLGGGGGAQQPASAPVPNSPQATPPPGTTLTGKQPPSVASILAASAPSDATVNLLKQISPLAGRAAQAAQATIPVPLPQMPLAPKNQPRAVVGVDPTDPNHVQAVNLVKQYLGTPYVWGGHKPGGFDCSGLVQYTLGKAGIQVPRTSQQQFATGTPVAKGKLRPGDAVFFEPGKGGPGHEGMYIGNNQFIEAPHTGAVVRIANLAGRKDYVGARRFG
jgi:cell wall-associated NlpC family hydrolase